MRRVWDMGLYPQQANVAALKEISESRMGHTRATVVSSAEAYTQSVRLNDDLYLLLLDQAWSQLQQSRARHVYIDWQDALVSTLSSGAT